MEPSVRGDARDTRVARGEGHQIGATVAVLRQRYTSQRQPGAGDDLGRGGRDVDARGRLGQYVDQGIPEHLPLLAGEIRDRRDADIAVVTALHQPGRIDVAFGAA